MAKFEIVMPKMGESVQEATITKWFVKVGDKVEDEDVLLEIATDKVDSEIPSPVDGTVEELLFQENDVVPVGKVIAIISLDGELGQETSTNKNTSDEKTVQSEIKPEAKPIPAETREVEKINSISGRFYSPLVKSIAKKENIGIEELEKIAGTGKDGRVKKEDILNYIFKKTGKTVLVADEAVEKAPDAQVEKPKPPKINVSVGSGDEIEEMDRMRKIIADHMVMSKQTSPHVTSVVEADVTKLVLWRTKVKDSFQKKHGVKITYMPVFIEAVAKALADFPGVNVSVDGYKIIKKKNINIGIAVALPSGNLIVPVIKKATQKSLVGLAEDLSLLANAARNNKLGPDDIQGGTFTITNFGSFRNIMGTPIINQPQVAILATGSIEKKPAVIETPTGDTIGIRHKMFLSLSYDHRVVDGALGGAFLRRIADYLEGFDLERDY